MTKKNINFAKINSALIVGAIAVAAVAPGFYMSEPVNGLTEEQVQKIVDDGLAGLNLSDADKVDAIYADMFKADAWEAESEVLALEELEDDNYEELFDAMDSDILNLSIEDEKDIDKVIVRDISFRDADVDDKDILVDLELKVYYEDLDGDDKKEYINATVTIIDGEVDDIEFVLAD